MVVLSVASAIMLVAAQNAAANSSRLALRTCLKEAVTQAKTDKVAADAFKAFADQRCADPAASLKSALVNFDVKNKIPRKRAAADAQMDVDDEIGVVSTRYAADLARE